MNENKNYAEQYLNKTYAGKRLLEKHSLQMYGLWHVTGEDENCDLGGSHHCPSLGFFEGFLLDVVNYCVQLPRFWTWGAGGDFSLVTVSQVNPGDNPIRKSLDAEKTILTARLEEINSKLAKEV